ncbi:MAG: ATP-binding protein [Rubrivivax sp.]|nr:ATP-binding protein [Rubrivivax sp.]
MKLSLRAKGQLVSVALALYAVTMGYILTHERQALLQLAIDLEQHDARGAALARAASAIDHSILGIQRRLLSDDSETPSDGDLAFDVETFHSSLQDLRMPPGEFVEVSAGLAQKLDEYRQAPSRSHLLGVQETARVAHARLEALDATMRQRHKRAWQAYYRVYDRMTLLAVAINLVGAVLFGALIMLFFRRLTWDIHKLGARADGVATGYRGPLLDVTRNDEVGELMQAVNRMQLELRQREQKLEVAREQHFHREKMAAIGSLAAAVAHEVNNPIAAIVGIVEMMLKRGSAAPGGEHELRHGELQLVLEQAQRIAAISRELAEFTRPRAATPQLVDLNALVRSTCRFIAYDPRLRGVEVVLELDRDVPALLAVADHLTQVLMNLMINAADALGGVAGRKPTIRVVTRPTGGEVTLEVIDNGHGMAAETAARAFDESFSTKPAEKGRGIGLFLCKELLALGGGWIELASTPGSGTRVAIHLPSLPADDA